MVLSNPQTPPLGTLSLVSGPSGPQLYGPPYLFSCNSTTAHSAPDPGQCGSITCTRWEYSGSILVRGGDMCMGLDKALAQLHRTSFDNWCLRRLNCCNLTSYLNGWQSAVKEAGELPKIMVCTSLVRHHLFAKIWNLVSYFTISK